MLTTAVAASYSRLDQWPCTTTWRLSTPSAVRRACPEGTLSLLKSCGDAWMRAMMAHERMSRSRGWAATSLG
eukprot:2678852-Prymnesium_polylepis.2